MRGEVKALEVDQKFGKRKLTLTVVINDATVEQRDYLSRLHGDKSILSFSIVRDPVSMEIIDETEEGEHWVDAFLLDQLIEPLIASEDAEISTYGQQLKMRVSEMRTVISRLLRQHSADTTRMGKMIFDDATFKLHNFSMPDRDALIIRQWFDSLQDMATAQYWTADDYRIAIELYKICRMRVPDVLIMRFENLLKSQGEDKL